MDFVQRMTVKLVVKSVVMSVVMSVVIDKVVVTPVMLMRKLSMELVVMQAAAVEKIVVGTSWLVVGQWH